MWKLLEHLRILGMKNFVCGKPVKNMYVLKHFSYRILAFSLSRITDVKVKIDNEGWQLCDHVRGPLYVSKWDPSLYKTGLHRIEVS